VDLTLYHNSENNVGSPSRGAKWALIYDTNLKDVGSGNVRIGWGNGNHYVFGNVNGVYTPPPGIHDRLIANGSPIASYDLIRKDQTDWHFAPYGSSGYFYLTTISDENGNVITVNRAASNGGMLGLTDPTGRQVTFGYNSTYYTSLTDPKGRVFSFGFDGSGNMSSVTYPTLNGTSYSLNLGYDSNHNITSIKDLRGNTATLSYNSADNSIAWERDNLGNQTTFTYGYDGVRNVTSALATTVTDANSHNTAYWYDNTGRLSAVYDALGYHESYTFDAANNLTQKLDRRGFPWNKTYDGMGNVLTASDPYTNTTTYTYNSHNRPLTITKPTGRSVAATYDGYDNLIQVQEKDANGNVLATTSFAIGSYGLVSSKTDTNQHTTQYGYDANGDLNSVTTPLGHQTQWTYDALGFQTSRTDAMGRTTTYTPDAWERPVTTTYPDTTTHTFAYDPNGNLTGFADPNTGAWSRTYDADNRLRTETNGGVTQVTHTYDAAGQQGLLATTTDAFGRTLTYSYTSRNELASVSEAAGPTSYTYDANGNQTHLYLPNGLRTDQYYNNDNTLQSYYNWDGGNFIYQSYGYGYNADHQLTGCNEASNYYCNGAPNVTNIAYDYDGQGRLTGETRTGSTPYTYGYGYDGAGNRTSKTVNGNGFTQFYDADDELTQINNLAVLAFGYNANGDQITTSANAVVTSFGYDYDDQLTSLSRPGYTATYQYDALGRQVLRTVGGVATAYHYDGSSVLFETQNGVETGQYSWGNGLIRRNGEWALDDGLGSTRQVMDGARTVTFSNAITGYGETVGVSGSTSSPYIFKGSSGYRTDADGPAGGSNYTKVGARYYDAEWGRFITRDTELGQKPYAYCDGDPVNNVDPTGHIVTSQTLSHMNLDIYMGNITEGFGIVDQAAIDPTLKSSPSHSSGSFSSSTSRNDQPAGGLVPITRGQALHLIGNIACGFVGGGLGLVLGGPVGGALGAVAGFTAAEAYQTRAAGKGYNQMFHGL